MQPPPALPVPVSGWQIGSTVATSVAAVIALAVVGINLVQRRADQQHERGREMERARAQARLVRVLPIEQFPRIGERVAGNEMLARAIPPSLGFSLAIINHGDRAILAVTAHVWSDGADPTAEPTAGSRVEVIAGGGDDCVLGVGLREDRSGPLPTIIAWCVHWTDADGRRWCYDQYPQEAPAEYTGQPPQPYS